LSIEFPEFDSLRCLPDGIYPEHIPQLNVADSGSAPLPGPVHTPEQEKRPGSRYLDKRLDDKFKSDI